MSANVDHRGILAFDLEIANPLSTPEDWDDRAAMGISCAATVTTRDRTPKVWSPSHGDSRYNLSTPYPHQFTPKDAVDLASYLLDMHATGWTVVTWNGAAFDFEVLAHAVQEGRWAKEVAELALSHIDPAFQARAELGYMMKLEKAAQALRVGGKTKGMSGALAPVLWTGLYPQLEPLDRQVLDQQIVTLGLKPGTRAAQDLCLEYVGQDALCTLEVYEALLKKGSFRWITGRGTLSRKPWRPRIRHRPVPARMTTVKESLAAPHVNTSWMTKAPKPRREMLNWALVLTKVVTPIQASLFDLTEPPGEDGGGE